MEFLSRAANPGMRRGQSKEESVGITLTPVAVNKVKEIMQQQEPSPAGLRLGVMGGGCSGF